MSRRATAALGPLLPALDAAVARRLRPDTEDGEPDGLDGLTTRGHPERLLVSEWLLAQEVPEEFLRRAVTGELLHLATARRGGARQGAAVLLLDCGPQLHGPPRLVHLALVLVLHRRAAADGRQLRVGVLQHEPGTWLTGDLPAVLADWLAARSAALPTPDQLAEWLTAVRRADQVWVVGAHDGPAALADLVAAQSDPAQPRPRLVTVDERDWTANGPATLAVQLAGEPVLLANPDPAQGIRVLRGTGWRGTSAAALAGSAPSGLHAISLPGCSPVLLARGARSGELVRQRIPQDGGPAPSAKVHRFDGQVLAGSVLGARLVVLLARGRSLVCRVIGKQLGRVDHLDVPLDAVELSEPDVGAMAAAPLPEVAYLDGGLLVRLDSGWWFLQPGADPIAMPQLLAVQARTATDQPRMLARAGSNLVLREAGRDRVLAPLTALDPGGGVVLGGDHVAWRTAPDTWTCLPGRSRQVRTTGSDGDRRLTLRVDAARRVIGLIDTPDGPGLLTLGSAGLLVGRVTTDGASTLTRWSGGLEVPVVHTRLPLLAVRRPDGAIEIGDLTTGRTLLRVAP